MIDNNGKKQETHAVAITPADGTVFTTYFSRIWVGTAGSIAVSTHDNDAITYTNVPVGYWNCPALRKVKATGTTASGLIGEY